MIVKLLTKHHLEFLSFKGGCTGSSESSLVKMPHCLKSHVAANIVLKIKGMKCMALNIFRIKGIFIKLHTRKSRYYIKYIEGSHAIVSKSL